MGETHAEPSAQGRCGVPARDRRRRAGRLERRVVGGGQLPQREPVHGQGGPDPRRGRRADRAHAGARPPAVAGVGHGPAARGTVPRVRGPAGRAVRRVPHGVRRGGQRGTPRARHARLDRLRGQTRPLVRRDQEHHRTGGAPARGPAARRTRAQHRRAEARRALGRLRHDRPGQAHRRRTHGRRSRADRRRVSQSRPAAGGRSRSPGSSSSAPLQFLVLCSSSGGPSCTPGSTIRSTPTPPAPSLRSSRGAS